ncbi:MAG: YdcF family protein [Gammaproteobacteria bacterium]|nr:YdcF family protein [Gammaproteobacteria bacterium]
MDQEIVNILKNILLPPGGLLLLGVLSLALSGRLFGKILLTLTLVSFYLLSTQFVATNLIAGLERHIFVTPEEITSSKAEAILVLASGRYEDALEYGGGDTIKGMSLERARYAAWLQRRTELPILVAGGDLRDRGISEAKLISQVLKEEFGRKVLATEEKSKSTWENILLTRQLLESHGIKKVALVTHAWHMPRAMQMFQDSEIDAIAAPTIFSTGKLTVSRSQTQDWLPNSSAFRESHIALHEYLGIAWYQIKRLAGLS